MWKLHSSATLTWFSTQSRRAISTADAGTYRWKGVRTRPKCAHWAMASRWLTDSPVSTSTIPSRRLPRSRDVSTRSGNIWPTPDLHAGRCSSPMLIATSWRRFSRACSMRMMRSCSSCSRTGRTRMGLTAPRVEVRSQRDAARKITGNSSRSARLMYRGTAQPPTAGLTPISFRLRMMR